MLHAQLTSAFGSDLGMTEDEAKKLAKDAIKSGNPLEYLAKTGTMAAAGAACGSIGGPYASALCAWGAGELFDKIVGPSCVDQGGVLWCMADCTYVGTSYVGPGGGSQTISICTHAKPVPPYRLSAKGRKCGASPYVGCCSKTYCQLPGMPSPLSEADAQMMADKLRSQVAREFKLPVSVAQTKKYPANSITAFDPSIKQWRVAAPAAGLSGEAVYTEIDKVPTQPTGPRVVSLTEYQERNREIPWYRGWRVWLIAGIAVAGITTGSVLFWRRHKKSRSA